jgi:hypothetical protein
MEEVKARPAADAYIEASSREDIGRSETEPLEDGRLARLALLEDTRHAESLAVEHEALETAATTVDEPILAHAVRFVDGLLLAAIPRSGRR